MKIVSQPASEILLVKDKLCGGPLVFKLADLVLLDAGPFNLGRKDRRPANKYSHLQGSKCCESSAKRAL